MSGKWDNYVSKNELIIITWKLGVLLRKVRVINSMTIAVLYLM